MVRGDDESYPRRIRRGFRVAVGIACSTEEATRAQLVRESQEVSGRFEFMHALIRQTLYNELSSPRRVRLHRQVADAIERLTQNMPNPPLAELANHFSQAASAGAVDQALRTTGWR
jgi:predicted ATPase